MPAARREIADDEVLTQYGQVDSWPMAEAPTFHCEPRAKDMEGLSAIAGRLTAEEACLLVQQGRCTDHSRCRVRHTLASDLRDRGFSVDHAPTKVNPNHVRVTHPVSWDDGTSTEFNLCFKHADEDV